MALRSDGCTPAYGAEAADAVATAGVDAACPTDNDRPRKSASRQASGSGRQTSGGDAAQREGDSITPILRANRTLGIARHHGAALGARDGLAVSAAGGLRRHPGPPLGIQLVEID